MTTQPPLIPKAPRRMKQPRKDLLRDALATVTDECIRLRAENEYLRTPWWRRLWRKAA